MKEFTLLPCLSVDFLGKMKKKSFAYSLDQIHLQGISYFTIKTLFVEKCFCESHMINLNFLD
jgi:hypothetical protein